MSEYCEHRSHLKTFNASIDRQRWAVTIFLESSKTFLPSNLKSDHFQLWMCRHYSIKESKDKGDFALILLLSSAHAPSHTYQYVHAHAHTPTHAHSHTRTTIHSLLSPTFFSLTDEQRGWYFLFKVFQNIFSFSCSCVLTQQLFWMISLISVEEWGSIK